VLRPAGIGGFHLGSAASTLQVVKARLQQRFLAGKPPPGFTGVWDCVGSIASREGVRGFYKGFSANIVRVAPQSALTLSIYEAIASALARLKHDGQ